MARREELPGVLRKPAGDRRCHARRRGAGSARDEFLPETEYARPVLTADGAGLAVMWRDHPRLWLCRALIRCDARGHQAEMPMVLVGEPAVQCRSLGADEHLRDAQPEVPTR